MAADGSEAADAALALLCTCGGLLLASDAQLPSVSTLVAGEPVRGSWWSHPSGHEIFRVLNALEDHPDVAFCKLVAGKVTLVHRDLWPSLVAVGSQQAAWQINGLSTAGVTLLDLVSSAGRLRTDSAQAHAASAPQRPRQAAAELEERLLVYGEEFHTEHGAHAKNLIRWDIWSAARGLDRLPSAEQGRVTLEEAVIKLGGDPGRLLPWRVATSRARRAKRTGDSRAGQQ